ncbi:MAG TPA: hypothetical protein VF532_15280 [Candidatus Angelobacter sp.]
MKIKATLLMLGLCLAALGAAAQNDMDERGERRVRITQGPTVSNDNGREATLTWTTDRPSFGRVRYRVGEGQWLMSEQRDETNYHALRLTGLQPGRRVEWQILARDGDVRTSGDFRTRGDDDDDRDRNYRPAHMPIYRADQPQTGQHLYTADQHEIRRVERQGWHSVGMVGYIAKSPAWGHIAIYRIYVSNGDHFYTTSPEERDTVVSRGGRDEGVVGYILKSQRPGTLPLHRMVSTKTGMHFYSANEREVAEATRHQGYRDEGVIGFLWLE